MQNKPSRTKGDQAGNPGGAYPVFALEDCVAFATAIKDLGGSRTAVKKSVIAQHFNVAQSTPSFFQKLSATKCFGIIDGWGAYTLTESAKRYFYPTSDSGKNEAGLIFLRTPPPFAILIQRFEGEKLPPIGMLGNILHQEASIPESWKDRLASVFIRSAQFLGIIDNGGILRYDASMHTSKPPENSEPTQPNWRKDPMSVPAELVPSEPAPPGIDVWSYSRNGKQIRVQTPESISKELWEKLNSYVQILKPAE